MVFGEGLSVFKRFKVGYSRGMLPGKNDLMFRRNVIVGIFAENTNIQIKIIIAMFSNKFLQVV